MSKVALGEPIHTQTLTNTFIYLSSVGNVPYNMGEVRCHSVSPSFQLRIPLA